MDKYFSHPLVIKKDFYLDKTPIDRQELFSGKIIVLQNLNWLQEFVFYLREKLTQYLNITNLQEIHLRYSYEQFNQLKIDFNQQLTKIPIADSYHKLMDALSWNLQEANFDAPIVRMNPPLEYSNQGVIPLRSFTKIHRDTWGVNIMSQINLWAPLFPVNAENSFAIYPYYWNREIKNNTREWSFSEYLKKKDEDYPLMPIALEEISTSDDLKVTIEPGELLLFSSAHLHSSIPNTSDLTRINFETRCYFDSDFALQRGAINIDTWGQKPATRLFKKI